MKTEKCSFGKLFLSKRFVVIAIVLCSVLLVALPVIAAEDDFVLGIYGNANEDDTIDMRDLTYVKLIFFGEKPETKLADAKYDGEINPLDFVQIKLVIVGKETELTLVDSADRIVTVKKPVEGIVALTPYSAEAIRTVKAKDKVVGVCMNTAGQNKFFSELSKLPVAGSAFGFTPNVEAILSLTPDVVICLKQWPSADKLEDKLEKTDIMVVRMDFYMAENMRDEFVKLGYILDMRYEAKEFIGFYEGYLDKIKDRTKALSEDEKPRVFMEDHNEYTTYTKDTKMDGFCTIAGGINIAADLIPPGGFPTIDPEWVLEQNPDIVIKVPTIGIANGYDVDDSSEMKVERDRIMNRPGWVRINAVKNGRVYPITIVTGGPKLFVGITYMAKWFHPDLFEDFDPKAIHQEYLARFQGLDFDLDEHGVFVYPEPS